MGVSGHSSRFPRRSLKNLGSLGVSLDHVLANPALLGTATYRSESSHRRNYCMYVAVYSSRKWAHGYDRLLCRYVA